MNVTERIKQLLKLVQVDIFEKEEIFNLIMIALLAGESVFLLGKPGIAKSLVARRIKYIFEKATVFEYLMNRFSTPEEIFGPISINELQKGNYMRIINGYLPTANVAFLDEIWKAGPSIQNTLLTIVNEKIYRNGDQDVLVPLNVLVAASNELPAIGEGLEALFDRFIIRYISIGIEKDEIFNKMISSNAMNEIKIDPKLQISKSEYKQWKTDITKIKIDKTTFNFIKKLRRKLYFETQGNIYISDRRWKKITALMRASAFANGRDIVDKPDWLIIPHCIWNDEEQKIKYFRIFERLFVENLNIDILESRKTLHNRVDEINKISKELSTEKPIKKVYVNPFNSQIKGSYYRLIYNSSDKLSICFISVSDYNKLKKNRRAIVNLCLSWDPANIIAKKRNILNYSNDAEISNDNFELIYKVELVNPELAETTNDLIVELKEIENQLKKLDFNFLNEKKRLSEINCIFFNDIFKLAVERAFLLDRINDKKL